MKRNFIALVQRKSLYCIPIHHRVSLRSPEKCAHNNPMQQQKKCSAWGKFVWQAVRFWTIKHPHGVGLVEVIAPCLFPGVKRSLFLILTFSPYRGQNWSHSGTVAPMQSVRMESSRFPSSCIIGSTRKSLSELQRGGGLTRSVPWGRGFGTNTLLKKGFYRNFNNSFIE